MNLDQDYTRISTDETLRETVQHGSDAFPFSYYYENIFQFDFHCIDWHWHPEVEFVFLEKGSACFLVGSEHLELTEGCGIFVNSQVIHRFEAVSDAVIPNIVFSPSLLAAKESLIYQKYIQPVLTSGMDFQIYSPCISWQNEILQALHSIFSIQQKETARELQTVQLLLKLWAVLYEHTCINENKTHTKVSARTQGQLQIMMQYIHKNYATAISLADISRSAMLGKSSALNIFRKYLHTSPINYLVEYRLKCAAKLLLTTENSITSIALDTGFESPGYFCRKFKQLFQCTPGEYRKTHLQ